VVRMRGAWFWPALGEYDGESDLIGGGGSVLSCLRVR
jgi:hypothetical protein